MALVDHATGAPVASLAFGDEGGERAALCDLLERADVRGRMITLDALRTVRETARLTTRRHGADYLAAVKGNAPETFAALSRSTGSGTGPGTTPVSRSRRTGGSNTGRSTS